MSPADELFYAVQSAIWQGWTAERIKEAVAESWEEVHKDLAKSGKELLNKK